MEEEGRGGEGDPPISFLTRVFEERKSRAEGREWKGFLFFPPSLGETWKRGGGTAALSNNQIDDTVSPFFPLSFPLYEQNWFSLWRY